MPTFWTTVSTGSRGITAKAREEDRDSVDAACSTGFRIRLSDDGPGIAPEDRERIFDAEFSRKPNGMGLGLFIARRLLRNMGSLYFAMILGSVAGACFEATFDGTWDYERRDEKAEVLLVEDEPVDLEHYRHDFPLVFRERGLDVETHPCQTFDEAFEHASSPLFRFDLIISDTYRGHARDRDAQVLRMVRHYRGNRFCPPVVYSSGVKPPDSQEGPFTVWADQAKSGDSRACDPPDSRY